MNQHDFRIYFNRKRQYVDVWLDNVHHSTFAKRGGGRWGYFSCGSRIPSTGKVGEIHIVKSRVRYDVVVHELFHLVVEWAWSRGETITRKNEERYATLLDELCRKFVRELRKIEPNIKL